MLDLGAVAAVQRRPWEVNVSVAVRVGSRYLARTVIGHGSFGTVFRADGPDGPVAVKLLRPDLARNPEVVNRFLQERSVLLRLRHPGIVPLRDLVAEGDVLGLVMELVEGRDLRTRLTSDGPLPEPQAARLVADVAGALAYAHSQGVVHRDVKPENILLARDRPVLTDFGIARLVASAATSGDGMVLGTPAYLAPELATGSPPSPAVDVYACGVLLYELITGRPPFVADHPLSVVHQHVSDPPQRPPGIPDDLWRTIDACLAKRPEDRPDADTLRLLLSEWASRPQTGTGAAVLGGQPATAPGAGEPTTAPGASEPGTAPGASEPRNDPTMAVPHIASTQRNGTRVLPMLSATDQPGPGTRPPAGRARIPSPAPPSPPDIEPEWQPTAPPPRRNWLMFGAALVAVAAVFLGAGFWLGSVNRDAEPDRRATADPTPSASAQPSPSPTTRVAYLSEMPFVQVGNGWGPVELNKSIGGTGPDDGGPLVLGGTTYERGLGVHAPSHVRIYPPQGCTTFKAVIGIDASSTGPIGGTVIFAVYADGQPRFDSGIVTRDSGPKPIQVDISGATIVDLVVGDAGDGIDYDIADWADAHLVCATGN